MGQELGKERLEDSKEQAGGERRPMRKAGHPQKPRKGCMDEAKFPRMPSGFERMPVPKLGGYLFKCPKSGEVIHRGF